MPAEVTAATAEIAALRAVLAQREAEILTLNATMAQRDATIADQMAQIVAMQQSIGLLIARAYGRSSEKRGCDPNQQTIDLGALTPVVDATPLIILPPEVKTLVPGRVANPRRTARAVIPETFETQTLELRELPESERTTSEGIVLVQVAIEEKVKVDYVPAKLVKVVEPVAVYGLPSSSEPVLTAPMAPSLVPNGLAADGLIIQIAFTKYNLHQPLHRQSEEFARQGLRLAKSSMCGWLTVLATFLMSVAHAVRDEVLAESLIHSDDIPVDQLTAADQKHARKKSGKTADTKEPSPSPGPRKPGVITARFWSYLGGGQVFYDYTTDRCGEHPASTLEHFFGALMADALAQYDHIVALNGLIRLACWAHVRRYFWEARKTDPRAMKMVNLIGRLYAVEARAREQHPQPGFARYRYRHRHRQRISRRVLTRIKTCLDTWHPETGTQRAIKGTLLAKAIVYAANQWTELNRFAETGDWPIDNNDGENVQRPIAVGRKNFLFMGSEVGGENAAIFYTLIHSCRLQRIDPMAYLKAVVAGLHINRPASELTPRAMVRSGELIPRPR
jgi:transposase